MRHALFLLAFLISPTAAADLPPGLQSAGVALAAGKLTEARTLLAPVLEKHPNHAAVQMTAGSLAWKQKRRQDAIHHFKRAALLDPQSPAKKILARAAPALASDCVLVDDADELARAFAFAVDFRRQREVEQALARFTTKKGITVRMKEVDWTEFMKFFVEYKYIERAGGPPTGKGAYVSDAAGDLRSTVYGSWRTKDKAPPALRGDAGFCAFPEDVVQAIKKRVPGAIEIGLPMLTPAEVATHVRKISGAIFATRDPWALDVLLKFLGDASEQAESLPPSLRPWLGQIARHQRKSNRWKALAYERRFGMKPSLPVPAHHFPLVLAELESGRVPVEAGLLALEGFGAKADQELTKQLTAGTSKNLTAVLDLIVHTKHPGALAALVGTLRSQESRWTMDRWRVLAALRTIAGETIGEEPAQWEAWLKQR